MTCWTAGWFRYLQGEDYAGQPIDIQGPRTEKSVRLARQEGMDPRPLLTVQDVFDSLPDNPSFVGELHVASEALRAGPRETIETWLGLHATGR